VYKIFGPGNQYVVAAKHYAQRFGVAIDMPAGPSEVLVVADRTANPVFAAADLLSQAEHGPDSQVVLVATSKAIAEVVVAEVDKQLQSLPRRDTIADALTNSFAVVVPDVSTAIEFSNTYAPEHLILNVENPAQYVGSISNAGSVFVGNYAPEAAGDYASGTNHTLPTAGWARSCSGVVLESFCKYVSFQVITPEGARNLGSTVMTMAQAEGLEAHRYAMEVRQ
jgi:histidinol dehydrogenase